MRKFNNSILILTGIVVIFLLVFFHFYEPVLEKADVKKIIGRIENEPISYSEFLAFVNDDPKELSFDQRKMVLDYIVAKRVINIFASKNNIIESEINPLIEKKKEYAYRKLLIDKYLDDIASRNIRITTDMKRDYFTKNPFIRLYAIVIPFQEEQALEKIYAAKNALDRGQPFFSVHLEYDASNRNRRDGLLGIFQLEEIPQPLYSEAKNLKRPFEHSNYIELQSEYMILYRGSNPDFDTVRSFINEVLEDEQKQANIRDYMLALQNRVLVNQRLVQQILSENNSLSTISDDLTIASFLDSNFSLTLKKFKLRLADLFKIEQINNLRNEQLISFIRDIANQEYLYNAAVANRIQRKRSFQSEWNQAKQKIKEEKEKKIISYVFNNYAKDITNVSDEDLREFFLREIENFRHPTLVRLQRLSVTNLDKARSIHNEILTSRRDFTEFVQKYSRDPGIENTSGITPYLTKTDLGDHYYNIVSREVGDILEPVFFDGFFVIYKIIDKQKGALKHFSDVQEDIKADLLMKRINEWIDQIVYDYNLNVQKYYHELEFI